MSKQLYINFITSQPGNIVEPFLFPETQHRVILSNEATRNQCYRMEDHKPQTFTSENTRRWYYSDLVAGGNPEGLTELIKKTEILAPVLVIEAIQENDIRNKSMFGCYRFRGV